MIVTGIRTYTPIRQVQNFGKKKSDVDDYKTAENTIKEIKQELAELDRKIMAANNGINSDKVTNDYCTKLKNITLPELETQKKETQIRLAKWEKIKTMLENKLNI